MSRFTTTGIHPETDAEVEIAYGYDLVPGLKPGYFFQVFSKDPVDIENDPSGDGLIVNEGFGKGISHEDLLKCVKEWQVEDFFKPKEEM